MVFRSKYGIVEGMSNAEKRTRLSDIEEILTSGVTETTVDGVTTKFDLDSLRRERHQLQVSLGIKRRRRRVFGLTMGGRDGGYSW